MKQDGTKKNQNLTMSFIILNLIKYCLDLTGMQKCPKSTKNFQINIISIIIPIIEKKTNNYLNSNHNVNSVKIIDKSYIQKDFNGGIHQNVITKSIEKFNLNSEQQKTFQIITNHGISPSNDQLKMYLGGMGSTGKSQVLKALSYFFETRNESH